MRKSILASLFFGLSLAATSALADGLPADLQAKVDGYKAKLQEWAASPMVVDAVKASNAKGGIPGMNNAKWVDLPDNDPQVTALQNSAAGKQVSKWETDKNLLKLNIRDEKGNLVAASSSAKPLLYNNATKPPFMNGLKGAWSAPAIKPDPTTQQKSVQIGVPVMDGGKAIGVMHSAVVAE